jgi:hypothetical protein
MRVLDIAPVIAHRLIRNIFHEHLRFDGFALFEHRALENNPAAQGVGGG